MSTELTVSPEQTFRRLLQHLQRTDPTLKVRLRRGRAAEFPNVRDHAYCRDATGRGQVITIVCAPKMWHASPERVLGLLAHEFGHAVHMHCKRHRHSERDADSLAKTLFGFTVKYDRELVQTCGAGQSPRPLHLPR